VLEDKKKRSLRGLKGFVVILLIYVVLAVVSAVFYPKGFSPLTNTLPQLGDPALNPAGAILYNIGVYVICGSTFFIVVALLATPKQWLTSRGAKRMNLFYFTLASMFLFTLFYVLTALALASKNYGLNGLFTLLFLSFLELFVACSAAGIRRLNDYVHWVPLFGFAVAILIPLLVVASAVYGFSLFSWLIAVLSWSYMVAFLYEFSASKEPAPKAASETDGVLH